MTVCCLDTVSQLLISVAGSLCFGWGNGETENRTNQVYSGLSIRLFHDWELFQDLHEAIGSDQTINKDG